MSKIFLAAFVLAMVSSAAPVSKQQQSRPHTPAATQPRPKVLVFSKTAGFRHDSIPDGIRAIEQLGAAHGFDSEATEDAGRFTAESLARFQAVIFLNTTGDVLNDSQQEAFEQFIRGGGGFVGVHSATDTEYDWPWYTRMVGAQFASHPKIQEASIDVVDREHASTRHLPQRWTRTDEWYNFRDQPEKVAGARLRILARLDESTYEGGTMQSNHPIAWCQEYDGGRAWYTALGHTKESFDEPDFRMHLLGGIQWAGKMNPPAAAGERSLP